MNKRTVGYLASGALSVATVGMLVAVSHRPVQNFSQKDFLVSQASESELALALDTAQILGTHQPVDAPLQVPDFQQGAELRKRVLDEIRQVAPVPEPSGLAALGLGLAVLLRRKAKR